MGWASGAGWLRVPGGAVGRGPRPGSTTVAASPPKQALGRRPSSGRPEPRVRGRGWSGDGARSCAGATSRRGRRDHDEGPVRARRIEELFQEIRALTDSSTMVEPHHERRLDLERRARARSSPRRALRPRPWVVAAAGDVPTDPATEPPRRAPGSSSVPGHRDRICYPPRARRQGVRPSRSRFYSGRSFAER